MKTIQLAIWNTIISSTTDTHTHTSTLSADRSNRSTFMIAPLFWDTFFLAIFFTFHWDGTLKRMNLEKKNNEIFNLQLCGLLFYTLNALFAARSYSVCFACANIVDGNFPTNLHRVWIVWQSRFMDFSIIDYDGRWAQEHVVSSQFEWILSHPYLLCNNWNDNNLHYKKHLFNTI